MAGILLPEEDDGCWIWAGSVHASGYGQLGYTQDGKFRTVRVHRLAWELTRGPIPEGLFVCHECDVRPCVRPDHLFLGTHEDNQRDMAEKDRSAHGNRHGRRSIAEVDAREILTLHFEEGVSKRELLERYPAVSYTALGFLLRGQSWRRVRASLGLPAYRRRGGRWPSQWSEG